METLKYKVIKSRAQYDEYCKILEELVFIQGGDKEVENEVELLTLLIERYDQENNSFDSIDPIEMLKHLMQENQLKPKDLVEILNVSKGLVSDILNYKKGLSKEVIRRLAERFSMNQETFNRPYTLQTPKKNIRPVARKNKQLA